MEPDRSPLKRKMVFQDPFRDFESLWRWLLDGLVCLRLGTLFMLVNVRGPWGGCLLLTPEGLFLGSSCVPFFGDPPKRLRFSCWLLYKPPKQGYSCWFSVRNDLPGFGNEPVGVLKETSSWMVCIRVIPILIPGI